MKFTAQIEIEVESDKEFTEAEGKRAAYALAATLNNQEKKGRPASGPRASVVGITVNNDHKDVFAIYASTSGGEKKPMPAPNTINICEPRNTDAME